MSSASVRRALQEAHAFHQRGDLAQAERRYAEVLAQSPRDPDALGLLGALYLQRGDQDRALQLLQAAILHRPTFTNAHFNLAQLHGARGDLATAEAHLKLVIKQEPHLARGHRALAAIFYQQKRRDEVLSALEAAAALEPEIIPDYVNMIKVHRQTDNIAGMLQVAERGLAKRPDAPDLHISRAEAWFEQGQLAEAWRELAWRFNASALPVPRKTFPFAEWQGEPLAGKSLLVWREQGIGDEIMYASMFGDLIAAGARCVIECNPRLAPLFSRAFPGIECVGEDTRPKEGERFDYHIALGSLGRWLRSEFGAFPRHEKYLSADPARTAELRARYIAGLDRPFLIGIAWKSTGVEFAVEKSAVLGTWGPIFGIPGVRFVNVQYGDCRAELAAARQGFGADIFEDAQVDPLKDLDAAAAQIAALDLVITTSNTAAHLAGALGVPTLCMLPKTLGLGRRWYWFTHQPTCPWYPSVHRILQAQEGDWTDAIAETALAAMDAASAKGAVAKPLKYLLSLAKSYASANLLTAADRTFVQADVAAPGTGQILYEWARLKKRMSRFDEALALIDSAVRASPDDTEYLNARGMTLMDLRRPAEAVHAYEAALQHKPDSPEVNNNLGTALRTLGRPKEALARYEKALERHPERAPILFNLGGTYSDLADVDRAVATYDRMLAADPAHVDAHYNKAQALLRGGRLAEGWRELVWRVRRPQANVRHEHFPAPVWAGQPLEGKKVLIWTEQGIGDEIMIASFVPDALARARRVTFLCTHRLLPLARRSFPKAIVDLRDLPLPAAATAPDIDFQMSLSELGSALRPDMAAFPGRKGFLVADGKRRAKLRARYDAAAPGHKIVGISWRSANPEIGNLKTTGLERWLPILKLPGLTFVNLQYGDTAEEVRAVTAQHEVQIVSDPEIDPLKDMDGAAAQIAAMDLVVSISNTTVHVAGGLGVPTFLMLAGYRGRPWYWFLDRTDSPWYPSVRLYDTAEALRWDELIARVAEGVQRFIADGR